MTRIRISDAAHRAIAEAAILPFQSTGERLPDGSWLITIGNEVCERLDRQRLEGESDDDVVLRIIRQYRGDKPS